tara:strand:- start:102 stop:530 length:429 start_codon:yes stop_codon:yes gene_type:complete
MEERIQVKCRYDDEMMHIQCVSEKVNRGREYGMAVKMRTTSDVSMWLREQTPTLRSAASGGEPTYTPCQIYQYPNKECQIFIPGTPHNHPQGFVGNLHVLSEKVKSLLGFAAEAGFLEQAQGEPYSTTVEEQGFDLGTGDEE